MVTQIPKDILCFAAFFPTFGSELVNVPSDQQVILFLVFMANVFLRVLCYI